MSLLQNSNAVTPSAAYDIENSCRWNSGSNGGLLSRTQGTPTGNQSFTYSFWWKGKTDIGGLSGNYDFDFLDCISADNDIIGFGRNDPRLYFSLRGGTGDGGIITSTAKFSDPASWYHFVIAVDTTQATASNRMRFYSNGVEITEFSTANYCAQNYVLQNINANGTTPRIGNQDGTYPGGCYMSEVHFIDGQQLTPSSFGELDDDTNQWKAKKYTGTYGNNGFFLEFQNSAALGTDTSGNGNNWTVSNLAATDQMIDTPQNSTGGNFATMNPLATSQTAMTFTEGNLEVIGNNDWQMTVGTMSMSSGKWYCELLCGGTNTKFGIAIDSVNVNTKQELSILYYPGNKIIDAVWSTYGASFGTGDIIGYAIDMDGSTITFYVNGASQGAIAFSGSVATAQSVIFGGALHTNKANFNFGQDSSFAGAKTAQNNKDGNDNGDFYYTPPSGYLAMCTNNLADPAIALPTEHFETIGWAGSSSNPGAARTIGGLSFQPDFFFQGASAAFGSTSGGGAHLTYDVLRGFGNDKEITTDSTKYEGAENADEYGFVSGVTSTGVTYSPGSRSYGDNVIYYDTTGAGYVRWNWKANGTGVSNGDGTITSTVSVNTTAGFSIVKYTGTGSNSDTVGHGLGVVPEMIIVKAYESGAQNWIVWTKDLTATTAYSLYLNTTTNQLNNVSYFYPTAPDTTKFWPGDGGATNGSGTDTIAYCFNSIEGYSKIGEYVSNNVADGPFIYLGFTPAMIMLKCINATDNWNIYDNKRKGYNGTGGTYQIRADTTAAGFTSAATMVDLVSNGMKIRTNDPGTNGSSRDYIYIAFAENPFKTSYGR